MLDYPEDIVDRLEALHKRVLKKKNPQFDSKLGRELLAIDPESGTGQLFLAADAEASGDLSEAERLAWEALDRLPNDCDSYLTLSRILIGRKQEALSRRMFHLGLWKTGLSQEVTPPVKQLCKHGLDMHEGLDDPLTYVEMAMTAEAVLKEKPDSPQVEERYRLLNALQRGAMEDMTPSTLEEVIKSAAVCAPLFYHSLRQAVREGDELAILSRCC